MYARNATNHQEAKKSHKKHKKTKRRERIGRKRRCTKGTSRDPPPPRPFGGPKGTQPQKGRTGREDEEKALLYFGRKETVGGMQEGGRRWGGRGNTSTYVSGSWEGGKRARVGACVGRMERGGGVVAVVFSFLFCRSPRRRFDQQKKNYSQKDTHISFLFLCLQILFLFFSSPLSSCLCLVFFSYYLFRRGGGLSFY